ncbi:MAG: 4-hydroxy-tetrahydrodipicolinate synthase [Dehalococcoidia bacterium]|nr:4-hydroxy-tetrahydrodipicolinate synthase [Dehalococcoidia bacterium]
MNRFGRLITAMVTPFDAKGAVDYAQAKRLALALLAAGSDSLVIAGTTGESPTLTTQEKLRLFSEVKAAVGNRGAVIAGTGSYGTDESMKLTREAEQTGVDGILLVVPYYNKPTQDGLFAHFSAIAKSTKLPCILYNVPARTVTNLNAETVIKLAQVDNIVALKEASGNLEQASKIIDGVPATFLVYSGNDSDTIPMMALGACGVVSVASHLVGRQIKDMMEAFLSGDTRGAAISHRRLLPLVNALFILSNPIPVKYAVNKIGFQVGKPRLPLTEPDEQTAVKLDAALKRYSIDLPV